MTHTLHGSTSRIRPSPWWYLLPAVLVVAGTFAAVLMVVSAVGRISDIDRQDGDEIIAVGDRQLSVFADVPPLGGTGPARAGACSLAPADGGAEVLTEGSGIELTLDEGSHHWVRIGIIPSGTPSGAYTLSCAGHSNDALAVAATDKIKSGAFLLVAGIVAAVASLVSALVALIVVIALRSRDKNRLRREQALASGYQPPYGYPPSA